MKKRLFLAVCITILGVAIIVWFLLSIYPDDLNLKYIVSIDKAAKIGDFIGGFVGALFTLVGILLIYETLNLQRIEFDQSRKIFIRQQFENTFFQMVNTHNEIINAMDIRKSQKSVKGNITDSSIIYANRDCFRYLYKLFCNEVRVSKNENISSVLSTYLDFYDRWESDLGHYFRHLYQIIKYIDIYGPETHTEKKIYSNILRSNISSNELLLLFYNCLSINGAEKFKPLIEKYNFFNNMPKDKVISIDHLKLYEERAYEQALS